MKIVLGNIFLIGFVILTSSVMAEELSASEFERRLPCRNDFNKAFSKGDRFGIAGVFKSGLPTYLQVTGLDSYYGRPGLFEKPRVRAGSLEEGLTKLFKLAATKLKDNDDDLRRILFEKALRTCKEVYDLPIKVSDFIADSSGACCEVVNANHVVCNGITYDRSTSTANGPRESGKIIERLNKDGTSSGKSKSMNL